MADDRPTSPLLAALLSAVVPGAGQLLAGARRRGLALVSVDLVLAAGAGIVLRDKVAALTLFVKPTALAWMMVVNILLLGYRAWAVDDAYRTAAAAGGRRRGGAGLAAGVVALAFVLLTPHLVFGYYDVVQYNLLNSLFGGNEAPVAAAATTTTTSSPPDGESPVSIATVPETTSTTAPVTVAGRPIWDGLDRLNILLLGGDFGVGRRGVRTDTIITVSIDPETGDVAMFQIPRNWTWNPLPEGMGRWDCDCYPDLINELWEMGTRYPEAFPGPQEPPVNAVKGVVSEFLGIPIHYYALVNLDGFVDIIDALGGVEIYVPKRIVDDEYPTLDGGFTKLVIEPGLQHMNGEQALAYARTRHADSDYFRMSRQRCVLEAVLEQTDPASLLLNFQKLADVLKRSLTTDIPLEALPQFVELLPKVDRESIVSLRFTPDVYHDRFRPDGKPGRVADFDLVQAHVRLVLDDPARAVRELGLDEREPDCGPPEDA